MKNPLLDQDFLRQLDLKRNKSTYAKIILLTWDENPVYEIQGKITSGSINVDGNSAVRRTCSLTMVAPNVDITNTYWALKNKFKLEVGVENEIDSQYPDIIWFKQGTYIFTSLNMSVQSNNFTISINGKDKMCLLNGEVGGSINASTDFGKLEEYSYVGEEIVRNIIDIPIVDIVKNAVHAFAGEPLSNIILNDIDNYGLELLEYRGDKPLYMPRNVKSGEVENMTTNSEQEYYKTQDCNENDTITVGSSNMKYYDRTNMTDNKLATSVWALSKDNKPIEYNIIKISQNETAGYRRTELTYPGELVANVGEALTSVLDKIKNMFSDFEYFYDVDGRFIFQKKKTYVNSTFSVLKTSDNRVYAEDVLYTSATTYSFEDGILLSAFTDAPQILNIKNDFSIWGKRKSASGTDIPVHLRYAIDFKPTYYFPIRFEYDEVDWEKEKYEQNKYYIIKDDKMTLATDKEKQDEVIYYKVTERQILKADSVLPSGEIIKPFVYIENQCDWRELIYQMALDYFKYNHIKDNFTQLVATANPEHYPSGVTGYETYYTDMQGFWRQVYNPEAIGETGTDGYIEKEITKGVSTGLFSTTDGFNENVHKYPEVLNFWFDFMDVGGEMGKYAITAIGSRPKAINNDKVTGIYFQETPQVLFLTQADYQKLVSNIEDYVDMTGYTFIQLTPAMENYFTISAQGKSAKDELDNLLYQHTYATEAVNLTAMPIYHLNPNTRIFVKDNNTGLHGEYIVSRVTVPLQFNGTTAITTTKAVERIY